MSAAAVTIDGVRFNVSDAVKVGRSRRYPVAMDTGKDQEPIGFVSRSGSKWLCFDLEGVQVGSSKKMQDDAIEQLFTLSKGEELPESEAEAKAEEKAQAARAKSAKKPKKAADKPKVAKKTERVDKAEGDAAESGTKKAKGKTRKPSKVQKKASSDEEAGQKEIRRKKPRKAKPNQGNVEMDADQVFEVPCADCGGSLEAAVMGTGKDPDDPRSACRKCNGQGAKITPIGLEIMAMSGYLIEFMARWSFIAGEPAAKKLDEINRKKAKAS